MRVLLDTAGGDVNVLDQVQWVSAGTEVTARLCEKTVARLLVEMCRRASADTTPTFRSEFAVGFLLQTGCTSLYLAAMNGHLPVLKFLAEEAKADPNKPDAVHVRNCLYVVV